MAVRVRLELTHRMNGERISNPLQYLLCLPHHMAGVVGLEPTKCRSQSPVPYHLATPQYMERIERIELSLQVWKTCVLTFTLYSQVVIYKAVYQIPFTTASALYTIPETNPNIKLGLYIYRTYFVAP